MGDTNISWADKTWNPVIGCSHVSEGCRNCYAEAMARRLAGRAGYATPWKPWTAPNAAHNVRLRPAVLDAPLYWRKPRRIFVNSMSDLFHEQVPDEFIDQVFAIMALASQHTYLVLTKRPQRMLAYVMAEDRLVYWAGGGIAPKPASTPSKVLWQAQGICDAGYRYQSYPTGNCFQWPLPNVWLGVSAEDQPRLDERAGILAQIPAAVRFLSAEPLLGPLDLRKWLGFICGHEPVNGNDARCEICSEEAKELDQVIIGGESGPGYRPMQMEWARSLIAQCKTAGVACFVKQDGALKPGQQGRFTDAEWALKEYPR